MTLPNFLRKGGCVFGIQDYIDGLFIPLRLRPRSSGGVRTEAALSLDR